MMWRNREWINEPETGFISDGIDIDSFQDALEVRGQRVPSGRHWITPRNKALKMIDPDPDALC